jgi:hypothetical protein
VTTDFSDPPSGVHLTMPDGARFRAAYERREHEIAAVPVERLAHLCIDVQDAVATVLGALRNIAQLGVQSAALPALSAANLERLEDYALALGHAHTLYLAESQPKASLPVLKARAFELRRDLRDDMQVLVRRGLLPSDCLSRLEDSNDPKEVAFDLLAMVVVVREHWDAIAAKTAIRVEELDVVQQVADEIVQAVGERLRKKKRASPARLMRRKAFTLLVEAYERVRSAVRFWRAEEGDWEKVAPSLYLERARQRKEKRRLAGKGMGVDGGEAADAGKARADASGGE